MSAQPPVKPLHHVMHRSGTVSAWEFTPRMHACPHKAFRPSSHRHLQQCQTARTTAAGCALGKASQPARPCGSAAGALAGLMPSASRCGNFTPPAAGARKRCSQSRRPIDAAQTPAGFRPWYRHDMLVEVSARVVLHREETHCTFCQRQLQDWRLAFLDLPLALPVMTVRSCRDVWRR